MNAAYVDTSCLVAIAFGEAGGARVLRRMQGFDELVSSNLLEAELLAAFARARTFRSTQPSLAESHGSFLKVP